MRNKAFVDTRGFFVSRFSATAFRDAGLPEFFAQDNHSRSIPRVIRGLHFQYDPPQGKLVWVTGGKMLDVIVDVRPESPTFLKVVTFILDGGDPDLMVWVPQGFAHGFCVLGDSNCDVVYKMSAPYNPQGESGLMWNDPELAINWPVKNPIISDRDKNLMSAADLRKFWGMS